MADPGSTQLYLDGDLSAYTEEDMRAMTPVLLMGLAIEAGLNPQIANDDAIDPERLIAFILEFKETGISPSGLPLTLQEKAQAKASLMAQPITYHALVANEKKAINALIEADARGEDFTGHKGPRRILDTIMAAGVGDEWLKSAYRKLGVSNVAELIEIAGSADLFIKPPEMTGDVAWGETQIIARAGAQHDRELGRIIP